MKNNAKNQPLAKTKTPSNAELDVPQRRQFFKSSAVAGAVLAGSSALSLAPTQIAVADDFSAFDKDKALGNDFRVTRAAELKIAAAEQHYNETLLLGDQLDNNDEHRYRNDNFYASFTKCLPSNNFGEVDPVQFRRLRRAMRTGKEQHFAAINLDGSAARRLENPQGGLRFEVSGLDSHATRINPSFTFRSAEGAAEAGEVYWQAITRDVPFIDYASSSLIDDAVNDLNNFSATAGAVDGGGNLSADTIFRGETPGDLNGPFISQFLLRDFNFGPSLIEQRYETPLANIDFMTDVGHWLNIQRGGAPAEVVGFDVTRRYIFNNRSLSEYVHRDALYQAYLYAALQILGMPGGAAKFDAGNPYFNGAVNNQTAFTSMGGPHILESVSRVANMSLTGAWFQKWRVHRFLRPEAYGGRVHFHMTGAKSYELHPDILNSQAVQSVFSANGTYLCPQAYSEGSPTHPSYPAGHATIAGACVTVLKAFFNEDFVIDDPVQADATGSNLVPYVGADLTLGGELNKLANNVAIGRDAAGVHYRQDGVQGLEAGQQQAIAYLQDQSRTFNEANFDGFTLTRFDGSQIKIANGNVTLI